MLNNLTLSSGDTAQPDKVVIIVLGILVLWAAWISVSYLRNRQKGRRKLSGPTKSQLIQQLRDGLKQACLVSGNYTVWFVVSGPNIRIGWHDIEHKYYSVMLSLSDVLNPSSTKNARMGVIHLIRLAQKSAMRVSRLNEGDVFQYLDWKG